MNSPFHVAVLIETSREYGRGLIRGVIRYQHEHGPWSIYFEPQGLEAPPPSWLRSWRGDGILARVNDRRMADAVLACGVPAIDLRSALPRFGLPRVGIDNASIVRMAAEHLVSLGLRRFAFFGAPPGENVWIDFRRDAFAEHFRRLGLPCDVYEYPPARRLSRSWENVQKSVAAWIAGLPKPVGVMASHDDQGRLLLDACLRAGVAVPDEAAVLGVDNDELLCAMCRPSLSSVDPDTRRIGYEAAALLHGLMTGRPPTQDDFFFPPSEVIARQSTDMLALEDREVAQALRYIRRHARHGLSVEDVLRAVPLSRTTLERRMRQAIGRTPKEEIHRLELEHVKKLLAGTNLSLAAIAAKVGYSQPQHLADMFKRKVGLTLGEYRRRHRV